MLKVPGSFCRQLISTLNYFYSTFPLPNSYRSQVSTFRQPNYVCTVLWRIKLWLIMVKRVLLNTHRDFYYFSQFFFQSHAMTLPIVEEYVGYSLNWEEKDKPSPDRKSLPILRHTPSPTPLAISQPRFQVFRHKNIENANRGERGRRGGGQGFQIGAILQSSFYC